MAEAKLSAHFATRRPSVIRMAQIEFAERRDGVQRDQRRHRQRLACRCTRPCSERLRTPGRAAAAPFAQGVVKYTATVGCAETNAAFLQRDRRQRFRDRPACTARSPTAAARPWNWSSSAAAARPASSERPLLLIDAAYTNYKAFAERLGRRTVSITRTLGDDGRFSLPVAGRDRARDGRSTKPGADGRHPLRQPDRPALRPRLAGATWPGSA